MADRAQTEDRSPEGEVAERPQRTKGGLFAKGNKLSIAHQWKPGQSGNPRGGSTAQRLQKWAEDLIVQDLAETLPATWRADAAKKLGCEPWELDGMAVGQVLLLVMTKMGLQGDLGAMRELTDRLWPKARRLEVTGEDGAPIEVRRIETGMDVGEAAAIYSEMLEEE